ncbi:macro domain-containing protein [Chloroflexus aggregans]|uniref:Appr-1-p processing domain protein n=1 Tax=Chloroflexus aggregans (strain MD-66 / DSM 9485) TaxID=326427 RepID=B8GBJ2_CHLAD|nr:macro domain-containing protein [Chloroflexus aggregans]ACL24820.1 Appr-1-p processing domain protein [Chloroflexus aggregans DSM 9485]
MTDLPALQIGQARIELCEGDIVTQSVDAIVNAANEQLRQGGGVCGAIFRAAGAADLQRACDAVAPCPTGEARITPGFALPARYVIHAVGPIFDSYSPTEADRLLVSAYRASLALARQYGVRSIAFPSIATGIYGFPVERAAPLVIRTLVDELRVHQSPALVRMVLWRDTFPVYRAALAQIAATS